MPRLLTYRLMTLRLATPETCDSGFASDYIFYIDLYRYYHDAVIRDTHDGINKSDGDSIGLHGVVHEEVLVLAERIQHELKMAGERGVQIDDGPVGAVQQSRRREGVPHEGDDVGIHRIG